MKLKNTISIFILFFLFSLIACKKDSDYTHGAKDIEKIALSKEALEMAEGDTVSIDAIFNSRKTQAAYSNLNWQIEDPSIAKLMENSGIQVPIVALLEGKTRITVETPDKELSAYRDINVVKALTLLNSVYIDFGTLIFGPPFNTVSNPKNNIINNLIDNKGNETGINLEITDDFEGENGSGVFSNQLGLPTLVSQDAFWGSNGNSKAEIKISKLNRNDYYDLNFFGSRRDVGDNRETAYTVTGRYGAVTVYQNASNNNSVISSVKKIRPNTQGEIIVTINAGPNNNNGAKYFYLNVMTIDPSVN